jgi:hypothetical protein
MYPDHQEYLPQVSDTPLCPLNALALLNLFALRALTRFSDPLSELEF